MVSGETRPWPARSEEEAAQILSAPGAPFEVEEVVIRGVATKVYKQAKWSLRELFDLGRTWGDREFIVYENERQTFGEHFAAAGALGRFMLERLGVKKGDRVAIAMRNLPEFSVAFWAIQAIGAVAVPLNAWGLGADLRHGIADSGARVIFADAERIERLRPHLETLSLSAVIAVRCDDVPPGVLRLADLIGKPSDYRNLTDTSPTDPGVDTDDLATILYTSGTTGRPKGAAGTHRNAFSCLINQQFSPQRARVRRGEDLLVSSPSDPQKTILLTMPLFHVVGCHNVLMASVGGGARLVLMHKWGAERFMELVERERVNATTMVPSMLWQILESPSLGQFDLSSLEGFGSGGAAAAPELIGRLSSTFPSQPVATGYGATETTSVATSIGAEDYVLRPNSVGLPPPAVDIKVVDERGEAVANGDAGELWVRGPSVIPGYWNNPEATASAFTDGWYHTGDIVRLDEDGYVLLLDRAKDMIIRGGENIYCVEIEAALVAHPDILDAAVVGLPHRVLGEEVAAVVQRKASSSVNEAAILEHLSELLPAHKLPAVIEVRIDSLPKNASNKTIKRDLRDQLLAKNSVEMPNSPAPVAH